MNTNYLIKHTSHQIQSQVIQYTRQGILVQAAYPSSFEGMQSDIQDKIRNFVLMNITPDVPVIACDNSFLSYAIVSSPEYLFFFGPVHFREDVSLIHHAPEFGFNLNSAPICGFQHFVEHILLVHNTFNTVLLHEHSIRLFNVDAKAEQDVTRHFSNILFHNMEDGTMHNPYDQEVREISSIRNGDLDQLQQSWSEQFDGQYGILAKENIRSIKNTCIVVITLASRAAIDGGVLPEIAFSLSDSYIYKIEELNDPQTIHRLCRNAEYEYASLVSDIKKQRVGKEGTRNYNPRIEQCKNYIFKHLHEKIQISDVARHLKINASYLAELFNQSEGISMKEFIMQEKMNLARHLLTYSTYTNSEIATSLGFCSQSHFGKNFKEITGFTPRKYRENYGIKDPFQMQ